MEQYGIRLSEVDMTWREFIDLLGCISIDTPLGRIVSIRSETDAEVIKGFNKHQRKIYDEWNGKNTANNIDAFFGFMKANI